MEIKRSCLVVYFEENSPDISVEENLDNYFEKVRMWLSRIGVVSQSKVIEKCITESVDERVTAVINFALKNNIELIIYPSIQKNSWPGPAAQNYFRIIEKLCSLKELLIKRKSIHLISIAPHYSSKESLMERLQPIIS